MPAALMAKGTSVQAAAARNLTKAFADSAGVGAGTIADLLARALDDDDPQRAHQRAPLPRYIPPADGCRSRGAAGQRPVAQRRGAGHRDAGRCGRLRGGCGAHAHAGERKNFAMRRSALLALARVSTPRPSGRRRHRGPSRRTGANAPSLPKRRPTRLGEAGAAPFLTDPMRAWWRPRCRAGSPGRTAPRRRSSPRRETLAGHRDAMVRARPPPCSSAPPTRPTCRRSPGSSAPPRADSFPDATINALDALFAIAKASPAGRVRVDTEYLNTRAGRTTTWCVAGPRTTGPRLAARWGPVWPISTGRTPQDYRDIVRRFMLPRSPEGATHVFIEVDQKGTVEIELFGSEAPLTVANYLRAGGPALLRPAALPSRDPQLRGAGRRSPRRRQRRSRAPRSATRSNRRATRASCSAWRSPGPTPAAAQWFVNLSPQPHLDGTYTIFGKVVSGHGTMLRVLQGDQIRTIRR